MSTQGFAIRMVVSLANIGPWFETTHHPMIVLCTMEEFIIRWAILRFVDGLFDENKSSERRTSCTLREELIVNRKHEAILDPHLG
jgi:hypothetical protein